MGKPAVHALLIAVVLAGAAGCWSLPRSVDRSEVENEIRQKMTDANGNKPESVSCPEDLKPSVGASVDCQMKINGQVYGVSVTVTSIKGDTAKFDMKLDAPGTTGEPR